MIEQGDPTWRLWVWTVRIVARLWLLRYCPGGNDLLRERLDEVRENLKDVQ